MRDSAHPLRDAGPISVSALYVCAVPFTLSEHKPTRRGAQIVEHLQVLHKSRYLIENPYFSSVQIQGAQLLLSTG